MSLDSQRVEIVDAVEDRARDARVCYQRIQGMVLIDGEILCAGSLSCVLSRDLLQYLPSCAYILLCG